PTPATTASSPSCWTVRRAPWSSTWSRSGPSAASRPVGSLRRSASWPPTAPDHAAAGVPPHAPIASAVMASPSNSSRSGPAARGSRPAVAAGSHDPSPAPARLRADTTAAPDSQPRWPLLALWAIAGAVVVVGVAGQLWRPVAPDLGPPPDPRDLFDAAHLARVQAYQGPKRLLGLLALAVQVGVPVAAVVTRRGRRAVDAVA